MTTNHFDTPELDDAKRELVDRCRRLGPDGLSIGTSGNLSIRVGEWVAITPGSRAYSEIEVDNICVVALDGTKVDGDGVVSSEWPMHSIIYANTDAQAIVHTHTPEVVALSTTCLELPAIHYAIASLGGPVRVVKYSRFGSDELAKGVVDALESRTAAIIQNHGSVTYGANLTDAYNRALLLEWLSEVYRLALQYGEPRILSADELEDVTAEIVRRRNYGGFKAPED